jgi:hypothetical protein
VATTRGTTWVDRTVGTPGAYSYCVAALDRLWNLGGSSEVDVAG